MAKRCATGSINVTEREHPWRCHWCIPPEALAEDSFEIAIPTSPSSSMNVTLCREHALDLAKQILNYFL